MRKTLALVLFTIAVAACAGPAPSAAPTSSSGPITNPSQPPVPTPVPSVPSPSPSTSPTTSPPDGGARVELLPARLLHPGPGATSTFNWLPLLTIDSNQAIDGNVAIPAIFPGPLLIVPSARSITDAGNELIIDEARRLGLLGDITDFTGDGLMPGARAGNLQMIVDGVTHDLIGNPDLVVPCTGGQCQVDEGSPQAFAAFWQELLYLDPWVGGELGPSAHYQPERVAVLFTAPADGQGMQQQQVAWPLDENFETVGVEFPGQENGRCRTYSGDELADVLPILQDANQLTIFHDAVDGMRSAVAVVVVPGEESPCPDEVPSTT